MAATSARNRLSGRRAASWSKNSDAGLPKILLITQGGGFPIASGQDAGQNGSACSASPGDSRRRMRQPVRLGADAAQ